MVGKISVRGFDAMRRRLIYKAPDNATLYAPDEPKPAP